MGFFIKKNKSITSKLLKQKVIDNEVNIDLVKQSEIIEDTVPIYEKMGLNKSFTSSETEIKKPADVVLKKGLVVVPNTADIKTVETEIKKPDDVVLKKGLVVVKKEIKLNNTKIFKEDENPVISSETNQNYVNFKPNYVPAIDWIKQINKRIDYLLSINTVERSFIDLEKFKSFIFDKRIILVANSSDLLKNKNGSLIDSYDIVIRFNSFKIDKIHTGEKTTIHASVHLQDINLDYFVPVRFIISNNLNKWINKIKNLNKFNQSLLLKYNHHNEIIGHPKDKNPTTTGFVMLSLLLKIGGFKKVDLIGFNFYENGLNSILRTHEGTLLDISKVHDYGYEKMVIMDNAYEYDKKNNIITYYDNSSL